MSPPAPPGLPQKAAIAAARATARPAAGGRGRGRSSSRSPTPTPPRSKKGRRKDWASLMSWDESDTDDDWGPEPEPLPTGKAATPVRPHWGSASRRCGGKGWVGSCLGASGYNSPACGLPARIIWHSPCLTMRTALFVQPLPAGRLQEAGGGGGGERGRGGRGA